MIINTDNVGPPSLTGEHEGPAKASLLGRAAGVAYAMSVPQEATTLDGVSNVESDQCIRIRAWWTLVILDRWNALSTATPLIISGDTIVLPSNLKPIVGEANFRFTCESTHLGSNTLHHANISSAIVYNGALGARVGACAHELDPRGRSKGRSDIPLEHGNVAGSFPWRHPPGRRACIASRILALPITCVPFHAVFAAVRCSLGCEGIRRASDHTLPDDKPIEPSLHVPGCAVFNRAGKSQGFRGGSQGAIESTFGGEHRPIKLGWANSKQNSGHHAAPPQ